MRFSIQCAKQKPLARAHRIGARFVQPPVAGVELIEGTHGKMAGIH